MDAAELADLLSQVACFAPGQSFHIEGLQAATGGGCNGADGPSSTSSEFEDSSSASGGGSKGRRVDAARLRGAMHRSLVCVAAFAEEQHLPQHQHLAARGLAAPPAASQQQQAQQQEQQQRERLSGSWPRLRRPRRVLVGFARAVGDAALVATVHDVAVLPELQGLGLGRQLLERLTRQLDLLDIIDVGLLAPDSCHGFFSACSFGRDTENSTVMTLAGGASSRAELALEGMAVYLKLPAAVTDPPSR
ncbi:hypothetical protein ABPG77_009092 [Micractinium sp. CCAP 211/92]